MDSLRKAIRDAIDQLGEVDHEVRVAILHLQQQNPDLAVGHLRTATRIINSVRGAMGLRLQQSEARSEALRK